MVLDGQQNAKTQIHNQSVFWLVFLVFKDVPNKKFFLYFSEMRQYNIETSDTWPRISSNPKKEKLGSLNTKKYVQENNLSLPQTHLHSHAHGQTPHTYKPEDTHFSKTFPPSNNSNSKLDINNNSFKNNITSTTLTATYCRTPTATSATLTALKTK